MTHRVPPFPVSRRTALLALAGIVAPLAGCGGGGIAGLDSGGTGSFTTGTIVGLGSIIVGGVRYDDRAAVVVRSDGRPDAGLRVGMVVSIQGSTVVPTAPGGQATATADRITYASEWVGPVDAVDPAAGRFSVLGQPVDVLASTVFEGTALQLSELNTALSVEVFGYLDVGRGRLIATRVDSAAAPPPDVQLSGAVAAFDAALRTFRIGTVAIDASHLVLPAGFADARLVRVRLAPRPSGGTWTALRVDLRQAEAEALADAEGAQAEVEGTVTAFASPTRFNVNGLPVDARTARIQGSVTLGAAVQVHGRAAGGVLVAASVQVEQESDLEQREYEFYGTVSHLDATTRSFTLRGVEFVYTGSTRFDGGARLVDGAHLKVKAARTGGRWVALVIEPAD